MGHERQVQVLNGWAMLQVVIGDFLVAVVLLIAGAVRALRVLLPIVPAVMVGLGVFLCCGFFTLQPNEGRVLILFGAYQGTVRQPVGIGRIR